MILVSQISGRLSLFKAQIKLSGFHTGRTVQLFLPTSETLTTWLDVISSCLGNKIRRKAALLLATTGSRLYFVSDTRVTGKITGFVIPHIRISLYVYNLYLLYFILAQ